MQLPIQMTGSLNIAFEEKWNKMPEEFILKTCKSFRRRVDTIIEKQWLQYWMKLLFCVYIFILLFVLNWNESCFIIESFTIILEYS